MMVAAENTYRMPNNTYKSARIVGEEYNIFYAVWCTGEHELYDLNVHSPFFFQSFRKNADLPRRIPTK